MTHRYKALPLIADTIEVRGIKQAWLGRKVGFSRSNFNHLLKGRRTVGYEKAHAICDALGLPFFSGFELAPESEKLDGVAKERMTR